MFDIISFGSATFDIFFKKAPYLVLKSNKFVNKKGVCFPFAQKVAIEEVKSFSGGGAVNTAVSFARQGLKVSAIFSLGQDPVSLSILEELKKEKIDFSLANIKKEFKPSISVIISLSSSERTILHSKRRRALPEGIIKKLPKTKWVYIGPFIGEGTKLKDEKFLLKLLKELKKRKVFIASNPSHFDLKLYKKHPEFLNYFDVFILNQEETSFLTGVEYKKEKELFKKLDDLVEGIVIMTRGKKGAVVSNGYWLWVVKSFKEKKAIDRTGAGDAFGAGFVAGLIKTQKKDPKCLARKDLCLPYLMADALKLASANATAVVEHLGAHTGALKKNDLKDSRWQNLLIKTKKI